MIRTNSRQLAGTAYMQCGTALLDAHIMTPAQYPSISSHKRSSYRHAALIAAFAGFLQGSLEACVCFHGAGRGSSYNQCRVRRKMESVYSQEDYAEPRLNDNIQYRRCFNEKTANRLVSRLPWFADRAAAKRTSLPKSSR